MFLKILSNLPWQFFSLLFYKKRKLECWNTVWAIVPADSFIRDHWHQVTWVKSDSHMTLQNSYFALHTTFLQAVCFWWCWLESMVSPTDEWLGVFQTYKGVIVCTAEQIHVSYAHFVCCIIYRVTLIATTWAWFQKQFVTTDRSG